MRTLPRLGLALSTGTILLLTACGGDDGDSSGDASSERSADDEVSEAEVDNADCGAPPYTMSLKAGDLLDTEEFEVVSAKAVSLQDGAAYTIYLGDFEIDDDDIGMASTPEPPPGSTMVTLFITAFNATEPLGPIEVGQTIEYTPDFEVLTFRVIPQQGDELVNSNLAGEGTITMSGVGDEVCGEVTYTDSLTDDITDVQNRLTGTFSAEVVESLG